MTPDDYGLLQQMRVTGNYDANLIVGILSEEPFFQSETGVQALLHHAKVNAKPFTPRGSALVQAIDLVRYMKGEQRLGDLVAAIVLMSTPTPRKTLAQAEHEAQVNDLRAKLANTERLLAQANQAVADLTAHCRNEYRAHERELANLLAQQDIALRANVNRSAQIVRLQTEIEELRRHIRDAKCALLSVCVWTNVATVWYSGCGMAYNGTLHPGDTADLRHCPRCGSKIEIAKHD